MGVKFANNAYGTLNASITNTDTSLTLSSGQGARFPSLGAGDYFYVTLIDTSNNLEIAKCTARSSDVLTITRGQEGTTARAYAVGDRVELRITAQALVDNVGTNLDGDKGDITVSSSGTVWTIDDNSVDAAALNVSGNGTAGQGLISDGDGSFSWGSGFNELADVGFKFDNCGAEGPAGPSSNAITERYADIVGLNSSNLNVRGDGSGRQLITIQESGRYLIMCAGASGGAEGGQGGMSWGQIDLSANDVLYMYVGQQGTIGTSYSSNTPITDPESTVWSNDQTSNAVAYGGWGICVGGRSAGTSTGFCGSGGGATGVRRNGTAIGNTIIVAGAGGGSYNESNPNTDTTSHGHGGHGGGVVGTTGHGSASEDFATGGTQSSGGVGTSGGGTGSQTTGGNGGTNDGGGGGGGWYGGGGGGVNSPGAGGSGYVGGMISTRRGLSLGGNYGDGWIFIRKLT
jgi:hypothetical protein